MGASRDRRRTSERRMLLDRRMAIEAAESRVTERRRNGERRLGVERRLATMSAGDQIHEALRLLTRVIESGAVAEGEIRSLDAAVLRLRVALDQLEVE
jgi:hypothetical protein